jgi:hypothetical protein
MFTAKVSEETARIAIGHILMTAANAFTEDRADTTSSDFSEEAQRFCIEFLTDFRDSSTIGYDSNRKKRAHYIATKALNDFSREVEAQSDVQEPDYRFARQVLSKAVRQICVNILDADSPKVYEETVGPILASPTLREPLYDPNSEDYGKSVFILNSAFFEMKKRLKDKGILKGTISKNHVFIK